LIRHGGSEKYDAIVIGGDIGGLIAAAYLARAKARVVLFEAREDFGADARNLEFAPGFRGPIASQTAFALDGRAIRELRLAAFGLEFAQDNMKLVALGPAGKHVVLPGESFRGRAALAADAGPEGFAYAAFHEEAMRLARLMRPLWEGTLADAAAPSAADMLTLALRRLNLEDRDAERIIELSRLSATAFLDHWFDSGPLKAALAFEVFPSGLSPQEPGSALVLIWRYAQESAGPAAAVSQIRGGPAALTSALTAAAREAGAELRSTKRVGSIVVEKGRATGVTLADGEMVASETVLSSLDARETLLGLVPAGSGGLGMRTQVAEPRRIGCAQILLALSAPPPFVGIDPHDLAARFAVMQRGEVPDEAKGAALNGSLPREVAMEATVPTIADGTLAQGGSHVLSALVPYVPASPDGGWLGGHELLRRRALATLESFAPGLRDRVVAFRVLTPGHEGGGPKSCVSLFASPAARLVASYEARIRTPIAGLYLCGRAAEPMDVLSGRAGRIAAGFVFMGLRQGVST
jgi:phytoene dehydrogenase-like protein